MPMQPSEMGRSEHATLDDATGISLQGRWLLMVRMVWIGVVACVVAIFFFSLPLLYTQLEHICLGNDCLSEQLTSDTQRVLSGLGFSTSTYALISLIFIVAEAMVWFMMGCVLAWRKSHDWFVLVVALMLVLLGANNVMSILASSHALWQVPAQVCHFLSLVFLFLVFSLFPTGRIVPRWMVWLLVIWIAFQSLNIFFADASWGVNTWPFLLVACLWFPLLASLVVAQVYRFVRVSTPVQREQTKWVVFAVVAVIVGDFAIFLPPVLFPNLGESIYGLVSGPSFDLLTLLIPLSFGFALLRYHLWEIDVLINRTLVYGILTALLALVYGGLVIGMQAVVHLFTGQVLQSPIIVVASTLLIAALFQPLRRGIQRFIDRRFYRSKYDAVKTVAAFSATLRQEVDLEHLREHLLAVVQETMQPSSISLWLRTPDSTLSPPDRLPADQVPH